MSQLKQLDKRIIIVELDLQNERKRYEGLAIAYSVTKTAGAQMNEGEIRIANMLKSDREYLLQATTPFKRHKERKSVTLYVGYESTGTAKLFTGDITASSVTQPPDIWLTLKAKTGFFSRSSLLSYAGAEKEKFSGIAGQVADSMGLALDFQATDKFIENYSFTGGTGKQVNKLAEAGMIDAYVDDDRLIVKQSLVPLKGVRRRLSKDTGMIGIPELNEKGVKVKMLHDIETCVGSELVIESELNPAANGEYVIFKASYTGESHGQAFYIEAEASPKGRNLWQM